MMENDRQLIAILRGIKPGEAADIGKALVDAGISRIEVPLNSPEPFKSVENLSRSLEGSAEIGAGTVLRPSEVTAVRNSGGTFIVSPNTDREVIRKTKSEGMVSCPGVFTATEAFLAIDAGADVLKLFPASILGPSGIRAIKAVLPAYPPIFAVGGADSGNFKEYAEAGATGFGLGSSLYKPGSSPEQVLEKAQVICAAYDRLIDSNSSN